MNRATWGTSIAALAAIGGCGNGDAPRPKQPSVAASSSSSPASSIDAAVPVAPPPATVTLAASPRIDLRANAIRWHLYDPALIVPVAGEGVHPYDLDYRSGWGAVASVDGHDGRALLGTASLTVPWDGGDAHVVVRAHGHGALTVLVGNKKLGGGKLGAGWSTIAIDGAIAAGEPKLVVKAPKGTRVHSVTIGAGSGGCGAADAFPALSAAVSGGLGGVAKMSLYTDVPAGAYLTATPSGGHGKVTITPDGGDAATIFDGDSPGAAQTWSLDRFAGHLVRIDLEGCGVTWGAPAIALADRPALHPSAWTPVKNLVLVVVDTLRADHLRLYDPDSPVETPRLTAAARARGVVFARNQSMAPSSPPSHATIHTGQIPRVHGAVGDTQPVKPGSPTIAALLHAAGFYTAYVGNNDFAMGKLKKVATWDSNQTMYYLGKGKDCGPMVEYALTQLGKAKDAGKRAFVSVLPMEPHEPYRYHPGVSDKYWKGPWGPPVGKSVSSGLLGRIKKQSLTAAQWSQLKALYDGEVDHLDTCYGALEDGIAKLGMTDDTAVIVTSDHGEGMGERGGHASGHAYSLHAELATVPLILLGGGLPAGVVDVVSSNMDIAPTVLELLGLPIDGRMQGRSLLAMARAGTPWPERVVASEYGRMYALRGGHWHLVVDYEGRAQLYDLDADKQEAIDLPATAMARRWLYDAAGLYLAYRKDWRATTWGDLDDLSTGSPLAPG